jgi:hypothetical protein
VSAACVVPVRISKVYLLLVKKGKNIIKKVKHKILNLRER